jgi:hypothetical protein
MGSERLEMHAVLAGAPVAGSDKPRAPATPDIYFSADVETDGPIPGEYSMLSFALVYAGQFDGVRFEAPSRYDLALRLSFTRSPSTSSPKLWL